MYFAFATVWKKLHLALNYLTKNIILDILEIKAEWKRKHIKCVECRKEDNGDEIDG